jgi:hypothetical protein
MTTLRREFIDKLLEPSKVSDVATNFRASFKNLLHSLEQKPTGIQKDALTFTPPLVDTPFGVRPHNKRF